MNVGTSIEKGLCDLQTAVRRRKMQGGPKILFLGVDISAVVKKQLNKVTMFRRGCRYQWSSQSCFGNSRLHRTWSILLPPRTFRATTPQAMQSRGLHYAH